MREKLRDGREKISEKKVGVPLDYVKPGHESFNQNGCRVQHADHHTLRLLEGNVKFASRDGEQGERTEA